MGSVVPGKYVISYGVTMSGDYVMQISRYGVAIANSPSIVTINPGVPMASSCTTHPVQESDGLGMIGGKKSVPASFTIYARDRYGNVAKTPSIVSGLTVDMTADDGSKVNVDMASPMSGGRYRVS
ncbi:MAG: hypothetical protein ACK55Z_37685, partial [bacterium]